ncbi:MAG: type II toxin-antitoxin system death-on-curing family toxin [Candidatus Cloacimonetes bacterium]|nr:type II toxin-antitoxin system death-on-curing family toxin [Candidatus Cloacimonadota bacterium]NLO12135.1 type II toxin-antitoxin system death-on-curing family toxin [Candidatus Cloacimonadota bacterium]
MAIRYIDLEHAIKTHHLTIDVSGGGDIGIINSGQLESVLSHIQNDVYYPSFPDKLTHLIWGACKFHCFTDGNKRIAISLGAQFLLINGYLALTGKFIQYMENISYHVAAGNIDKDLLSRIVLALLEGNEEDESLKLEIYNAIKEDEG